LVESIQTFQHLEVCEQLAQYLARSQLPASVDPADDAVFDSLSRLVEYLTETRQLSREKLDSLETSAVFPRKQVFR
jgi:hypothetical protein